MIKYQILLAIMLCTIIVHAQKPECGSIFNLPEYELYIQKDKTLLRANRLSNGEVIYFPVQYHIFKNSSGNMALSTAETQIMTNILNSAYENANIQFYSCSDVEVITNNNYFNLNKSLELGLSEYDNPNAINVYICNTINDGKIAGYSYFPWQNINRIFIAKDYAKKTTIVHEFGHYFGLLHTHETYYGMEFIDGSNCGTAGDKLCDTPADPKLDDNTVDCDCIYIGNQYLNGLPYSPDTKNYMSYSRRECRTKFSEGQINVVRKYATSTRYHLANTKSIDNQTITKNETYSNDIFNIKNTKVKSGGNLTIDYCESVSINGPFEVELGATLEIK